jgi:molybdate transport system substrate-binding protein
MKLMTLKNLLCTGVLFFTAPFLRAAEISIFAAASLTDALKEIAALYEQKSGDKLTFNFGGSNVLARQIEQGAPVDLFLSADDAKMDALEQKNLILPGTRRSLLSNSLVIIVTNDSAVSIRSSADLAEPNVKRLALAEPQSVPAGIYSREYLEKLGLWVKVKVKVIPTENVRGALAAVESGNVDAGMVYRTDALVSKKVKIAVHIPQTEGPKISYPIAVTKASKQPDAAKKLAEFLAGPNAMKIFEKFGFTAAK